MLPALGCSTVTPTAQTSAPPPQAAQVMRVASQVLAEADALEAESRGYITRGNKLRRLLGQLRVQQRKLKADGPASAVVQDSLTALTAEIEGWESQGAGLRTRSQKLHAAAKMLLIEGFDVRWTTWISNPSPLVMEAGEDDIVAHNNQIRSVHPTLKGTVPTTSEMPEKHKGMSIRVPRLTGQKPPDTLNVSSFQVSRHRHFFSHVEVEPGTSGQPAPIPLNKIHQWRLLVSDLEGRPIDNAAIEVVGHMPGHVHGLPTQPAVTGQVAPGVYRVDGMKFQMNGWWVIQFNVEHGDRTDSFRYNLLL